MKKNFSINLFGNLYHIDEDAYALLERYLENIKRYFQHREGGEDISDDIEHRVAELLWERKQAGQVAVDVQTVRDIITKIGSPADIDPSAATDEAATRDNSAQAATATDAEPVSPRSRFAGRRLYRDMQDSILGGVCSGLCHYFNLSDPLLLRIILVLLFFFTRFSVGLVYIIMWLLVPQAATPEERLRMRGEAVTPEALNAEMVRMAERPDGGRQSDARRVWRIILIVVLTAVAYYLFCLLALRLSLPFFNSFFHGFFNMIPNL